MIEDIIFKEIERGQSEILLQHSTGEITRLLFTDTFPLKAKEHYMDAIHELMKSNPDLSANDDWFSIINMWLPNCHLIPPLGVGTYRDIERQRIGQRIKDIREEMHIEAKLLSKLSGVDAANICRIEQGKHSVGLDVLSKIANALGYKVDLVKITDN